MINTPEKIDDTTNPYSKPLFPANRADRNDPLIDAAAPQIMAIVPAIEQAGKPSFNIPNTDPDSSTIINTKLQIIPNIIFVILSTKNPP